MDEDYDKMREAIAKEYGFALFRQYGEAEAAHFINVDISTLKRWRRAGRTPFINMGERQIRYLGLHIADLLLRGDQWRNTQNGNSKSETTGSLSEKEAPHGTAQRSIKTASPDAFLLAQTVLKKPSKS